jgi:hypothetical protein
VITEAGRHRAKHIVLAAGVWSRDMAARLGTTIPLVAERGYHTMMPDPGVAMKISTLWEERKVIFTPMEHGLRASGIAEFAVRDAPPRYALAERLKRSGADTGAARRRQHTMDGAAASHPRLSSGNRPFVTASADHLRLRARPQRLQSRPGDRTAGGRNRRPANSKHRHRALSGGPFLTIIGASRFTKVRACRFLGEPYIRLHINDFLWSNNR